MEGIKNVTGNIFKSGLESDKTWIKTSLFPRKVKKKLVKKTKKLSI